VAKILPATQRYTAAPFLQESSMKRLLVGVALLASACSGNSTAPSTTTPPPAATAVVSISALTVTVEGAPGGLTYHPSFRLTETGGRSAATITSFTFALDNGGTGSLTGTAVRIPANGTTDTGILNVTENSGRSAATTMTVTVTFTDDGGRASSSNASASIRAIQLFALTGFVRDRTTGKNLGGATVTVASGPDNGKSTTASVEGYYAFAALQAGTFSVRASAPGYTPFAQDVTLAANLQSDFSIVPTPPAAPSVEYRITGTARRCAATYENSTGGTNQAEVPVPFSYSWNGARSGDFLYMSCQISSGGDTGNITVAIYKNGSLYRSATAIGFPNIATASGSY
jgi:Carboxypeptidase regulatory-like domain